MNVSRPKTAATLRIRLGAVSHYFTSPLIFQISVKPSRRDFMFREDAASIFLSGLIDSTSVSWLESGSSHFPLCISHTPAISLTLATNNRLPS